MSGAPALDWSTPAFAHMKPWRVRQIRRPRSARSSSVVSSSTAWTWRASLPCSAASARARSPGSTSASARRRPSAFETTLCATTSTSPAPSGGSSRAPASSAARSSPGRTSGRPGSGSSVSHRLGRVRGGDPVEQRARARRAAGARGQRGAQRGEVARACRRRARARAGADPHARACGVGERRVAGERPGPKAGSSAAGGAISSAFVPAPWRSGTITTPGARRGQQLRDLVRLERRAVTGHEQHPLRAALQRRATPAAGRRGLAGLLGIVHDRGARRSAAPRRQRLRGHDEHAVEPLDRPSASSTSAAIAAPAPAAARRPRPRRAAAWRGRSDLTGRTASVRTPGTLPTQRGGEFERLARHAPPGLGVGHLDVGLERRDLASRARR